ncbi:replication termination factor 2 [Ambystoma mexicanum]|uniref:replication termination factor 2 n=1 Tax=Ambystoma mexicanum TaxID=8296 RepID=UPI0037E92E52
MGCDGGTIPKRHELVKGPKKVEKVDKNAELVAQWYYCSLSQETLKKPIVTCELGRLYNKDAILEYLLDKAPDKPVAEVATHIKSIKHVVELNLTDNPAWQGDKGNTKGDRYDDLQCARFICPVVGLEMNGRHKFCVLRSCGCVFSLRAMREVKTDVCHKCGSTFHEDDIIILNGSKEEVALLKTKMEERRQKAKQERKSKKSKVVETVTQPTDMKEVPGPSEVKNANGIPLREKILFVSSSKAATDGSSSSSENGIKPASDTATKRPISEGERRSEVYKSIFTSHSSAKRAKPPNWITQTANYY